MSVGSSRVGPALAVGGPSGWSETVTAGAIEARRASGAIGHVFVTLHRVEIARSQPRAGVGLKPPH